MRSPFFVSLRCDEHVNNVLLIWQTQSVQQTGRGQSM